MLTKEAGMTLRVGVVGSGYIAKVIAQVMQAAQGVRLVAVASRRPERAAAFAQAHPGLIHFATWQDLVAWDGLDAVYVATPTVAREEIAIAAAQHGKHVLAEKPFASTASLQRIIAACQAQQVAFLDATHFVHHPRTMQLRQELAARIGQLQAISAAFFFPSMDRNNIRHDPQQEPMGAIGDMAWYTLRAVVEFTPADALPLLTQAVGSRDVLSGAMVRGAGMLHLSNGVTATWDVGYSVGTCIMDLALLGDQGMITLNDFVLDWAYGFPIADQHSPIGFVQRRGLATPAAFEQVQTASACQSVLMLEQFARMAADPQGQAVQASIEASIRTQTLLDGAWERINN
jgi:predicted dehydrogenase